jgi:nucleoside phosphorylase
MKRSMVIALALAATAVVPRAHAAVDLCTPRMLILSAFPGEIDRILTDPSHEIEETVVLDGRAFFVGTLRDRDVALALTGIGLVNAERTTRAALEHFECDGAPSITGIVFSGVAGGRNIGDVAVPTGWTAGEGEPEYAVDVAMLATVEAIKDDISLANEVPLGDVACVGTNPSLVEPITLEHQPEILIGRTGKSADPFGGRTFPCIPGGGDVFGCEACRAPERQAPDVVRFVTDAAPFIDPAFFFGYFQNPPPSQTSYAAEDMETLAVAEVATEHQVPFIAFRAASDGAGDPLMLPGFPFQFFVYRQLAADNAAAVALAFIERF